MRPLASPMTILCKVGCSGLSPNLIVGMRECAFRSNSVPHKQDRCQNRDNARELLPDHRSPCADGQPSHGMKTPAGQPCSSAG
jgi:hypothetical protein